MDPHSLPIDTGVDEDEVTGIGGVDGGLDGGELAGDCAGDSGPLCR